MYPQPSLQLRPGLGCVWPIRCSQRALLGGQCVKVREEGAIGGLAVMVVMGVEFGSSRAVAAELLTSSPKCHRRQTGVPSYRALQGDQALVLKMRLWMLALSCWELPAPLLNMGFFCKD